MELRKYPIMPAVVTMFDKEGNVDEASQRKMIRFMIDKDVDGFYIGGATGEGFLMCKEERKKVLSVCIEEIGKKVPAIAYVGANDTKTAVELAKFAEGCGADAISSVPPANCDFKAVKKYYTTLAESVKIPLLVYTNLTTRQLSVEEAVEICNIPNCIGMKYTAHNHYNLRMMTLKMPDKLIFGGADEMAGSAFIAGATGLIGSTYNLTPEIFMDLREAFEKGDMAEFIRLNEISVCVVDALIRCNFMSSMKTLLMKIGIGDGICREPFVSFEEKQLEPIIKEFTEIKEKYNITNVELFNKLCK